MAGQADAGRRTVPQPMPVASARGRVAIRRRSWPVSDAAGPVGSVIYTRSPVSAGPSLYRRHRPRTFADVVGQEHVVRTLRNAVEQGKVHHAYLFVGSRGTGKTSMAKILAACLNCAQGPTTEPCGVCPSCRSIATATSLDVIEMDAASNNSVDDIRELRESVAYAPVSGRSKVYILDEAHMLSPQAWNAFLKTLEEPPPHTIFVLATTEAQKVLPTVVDRCHRFDFARPTADQLAAVVRRVAEQEGDRDRRRRGRAPGAPRDRLLPRRARDARAARHLRGARHRDGRRPRRARGRRRRPALRRGGRRRRRRGRAGAARRGEHRRHGPRPDDVRQGPRGPRARAARRADARRDPRGAARDGRPRRAPGRAGPARRRGRRRAAARPAGRGAARGQGRRRRPHAARAGAGQGGRAGGRPVDARAARAHRAPGGRLPARRRPRSRRPRPPPAPAATVAPPDPEPAPKPERAAPRAEAAAAPAVAVAPEPQPQPRP